MLGRVLTRPAAERERFGAELAARYGRMGRRLVNADVEVADLEKLLSLPAWQKRHELYGVWVATEMLASVEDHEIDHPPHGGGAALRLRRSEGGRR